MEENNCSFFLTKQKNKPDIGFTTGTCAAAAACAAARMIVSGHPVLYVTVMTPKGIAVFIEILDITMDGNYARCAVKKMSGADPDVTNGVLVYAEVTVFDNNADCTASIDIDGGIGVGRVTLPGLDQPVGNAAINHVPRQMITDCVRKEIGQERSARVVISIPDGIELATKTFNPKLGIKGGISVLGTSGIVEPMSQQALLDTIKVEINMREALDYTVLPMAPGNYGKDFLLKEYGFSLDTAVTTSNFIYDSIQMACNSGFKRILFIGHIGKLVKVAGGIKNTHSKYGDHRMEILCKIEKDLYNECNSGIENCISTDDAVTLLKKAGIAEHVMKEMTIRIQRNMAEWASEGCQVEVIVFSNVHGVLGRTKKVDEWLALLAQDQALKI